MKVLVCGSRDWDDHALVDEVLQGIYDLFAVGWYVHHISALTIIEGGAFGADSCAMKWATDSPLHPGPGDLSAPDTLSGPPVEHIQVPAKWGEHHPDWCPGSYCKQLGRKPDGYGRPLRYCKGAGPRRNQEMLELGPDRVLAFKTDLRLNGPGGTEDMVHRALSANIPVATFGSYPKQPTFI